MKKETSKQFENSLTKKLNVDNLKIALNALVHAYKAHPDSKLLNEIISITKELRSS